MDNLLKFKNFKKLSFFKNLFNQTIRIINPSFKMENPYIYRFDSELNSRLISLYKNEIKKTKRVFTFQGQNFNINHHQIKLANKVFKNTDTINTMMGCFDCILKSSKINYLKKNKKLYDDIYLFLKFVVFAFSPILNVNYNSQDFYDSNIVRSFFLYIAQKTLSQYDEKFMSKYFENLNDNSLSSYSLNTLIFKLFKNDKTLISLPSFSFHHLNHFIVNLNGDTSIIRKHISGSQSINYYNYANLIMEVYLFCKKSRDKEDAKFGYLLGLIHMIKLELALKQNQKKSLSSLSILTNENYTSLSLYQTIILQKLIQIGKVTEEKINKISSILTESENKVWLKDEPKMPTSTIIALVLNYIFMIIWAIIILFPVFLLVKLTFNSQSLHELNAISFEFSARNFEYLFNETFFWSWTKNTFIIAFATATIVTLFCSLLAYAYSRFEFRGKRLSIGGIMVFQMIPASLALVVFIIYGKFFTDELQLEGAHLYVLIIIYSGGAIAGNTFLLKGYMDTISPEVFDAARIDGCSHLRVFRTIAIPLAKPMMAVIFLWSFIGPFFDFLLPTILSGNVVEDLTMAAGLNTLIADTTQHQSSPGAYAAGGLLVALPFAILFLSLNKQIVNGLTAGAVK